MVPNKALVKIIIEDEAVMVGTFSTCAAALGLNHAPGGLNALKRPSIPDPG